jgi:hypothetical protein
MEETDSSISIRLNAEYVNGRCYIGIFFSIVHIHMLDFQWPVHLSYDLCTKNVMSVTHFNGNFTAGCVYSCAYLRGSWF